LAESIPWNRFVGSLNVNKYGLRLHRLAESIPGLLKRLQIPERNFVPKNPEKFLGIDSEQLPLFRGRKCSFRGIPRFTEESIPKLGTEGNGMKKISFTKNPAPANRIDSIFSSETCLGTEFRVVDFSAEWFGTEFQVFAGLHILYFCSTERNSELFSLPRNGSDRNSERHLILFHGKEFREFSVPRKSRNSAGTN
jgi:hypothetical protein